MAAVQPATSDARPCIRCGRCAEACPVGLLPQQLHAWARLGLDARLDEYGLAACVECGRCDALCPSRIPLVAHFREAKSMLAERDAAAAFAAESRTRYHARNRRLAEEDRRRRDEQAARQGAASADAVQAALARARARRRDAGSAPE